MTDKTEREHRVTNKKEEKKKRKVFPALLNVMRHRGWGTVTVWKDAVSSLTAEERSAGRKVERHGGKWGRICFRICKVLQV